MHAAEALDKLQSMSSTDGSGMAHDGSGMAHGELKQSYEDLESAQALAVLVMMGLMILTLSIGRLLEYRKVSWLSEATVAVFVGMATGFVVSLFKDIIDPHFYSLFPFNPDYYFLFLLPPIIFNAGFNLEVMRLFNNMGTIGTMAFLGTIIAAASIAGVMWAAGALHLSPTFSLFHSSLYGAIVSAIDPVSVLAVFAQLNANADLDMLVFGESVLNDAVAVVLYTVVYTKFKYSEGGAQTLLTISKAGGLFLGIFGGSVAIGLCIALVCALVFRSFEFSEDHAPFESALLLLFAYCSFYIAQGLQLSGITTIIFCGIGMAKYCRPFMSDSGSAHVGAVFGVLGYLAETFTFLYIGQSLFTDDWIRVVPKAWPFLLWSLLALALSRLVSVYPLVALCNWLTPPRGRKIPLAFQNILWFSGLRGAMAFALASQARDALNGTPTGDFVGDVLVSATFFVIVVTVLFNGGTVQYLLEYYNLIELDEQPHNRDFDQEENRRPSMAVDDDAHDGHSRLLRHQISNMQVNSSMTLRSLRHQHTISERPPQRRRVLRSIHSFQRRGGFLRHLKSFDKFIMSTLFPKVHAQNQEAEQQQLRQQQVPSREQQHPRTLEAEQAVARAEEQLRAEHGENGENGEASGNGQ